MLTEAQSLVLKIIESVYTDGIDAIAEPELDNQGDIVCKFQDGPKILTAIIYPNRDKNDIEITVDNPEAIDDGGADN